MSHNRAIAIARPWHEGSVFMKRHAGNRWHGEALWGRTRNTWIKVIID